MVFKHSMRPMKKYLLAAICLSAIFAIPLRLDAGFQAQTLNYTVSFYNVEENPPHLPFMSFIFVSLPEDKVKQVDQWKKEIDEKLQKLGGIHSEDDYKKINEVVPNYIQRFVSSGAIGVAITFPIRKMAILLHKIAPQDLDPSLKP